MPTQTHSKGKKQAFDISDNFQDGNRYSNLNLNQSYKCSSLKSDVNGNGMKSDNSKTKKNLQTWKEVTSKSDLFSATFNDKIEEKDGAEKCWKKDATSESISIC